MILDEIAAKTRERVARCKENVSLEEMKKKALSLPAETRVSLALPKFWAFICSNASVIALKSKWYSFV